jgi:uncharacterized protein YwqG
MSRFFRRKRHVPVSEAPPPRDLEPLIAPLASPALRVVDVDGPTLSYLGGSPLLPPGVEWPVWNGNRLTFLARLSMTEMAVVGVLPWLPDSGALLFFYDTDSQPWGFDPAHRGGAAVLAVPDAPLFGSEENVTAGEFRLPRRYVGFTPIMSLPSWERPEVEELELSEEELELLDELTSRPYAGGPAHQVGGYPIPIQGDQMEVECQLASHGIAVGDPSGSIGPAADALKPRAAEWRLLLQLDSDDQLDLMWGDGGKIYFWVPETAARRGDFTGAWLILQCY